MPTYKLQGPQEALLCRLSKKLSIEMQRRVTKKDVLERILDVVIKEERLFSEQEQPVSFFRRSIYQPNLTTSTERKTSEDIITDAIRKTTSN